MQQQKQQQVEGQLKVSSQCQLPSALTAAGQAVTPAVTHLTGLRHHPQYVLTYPQLSMLPALLPALLLLLLAVSQALLGCCLLMLTGCKPCCTNCNRRQCNWLHHGHQDQQQQQQQ
jgi:hypothetical protein